MDSEFRWYHALGCYGMLGCAITALSLLVVAGGYTLSTGGALQLPIVPLLIGWGAALAVFELLAFGWLIVRGAAFAATGGAFAVLIAEGIRVLT